MKRILTTLLALILGFCQAQITQSIRGTITDQVLQTPLAGATVQLSGLNWKTIADSNGVFRFSGVPVGQYSIDLSFTGYKPSTTSNLTVIAGKELVLALSLEQTMAEQQGVLVKGKDKRNKPLNDMSLVSARAFTVDETQKYAAAVNDPLRMATNFAGVVGADDGNNNIVIRGNAPTGLLWRMEGIDIPNPNHFTQSGSSGGGISILSAQLLSNSDFMTGAFAAEYGNALSGVFDLKLRKGNNEKREYALQAGFLGLNVSAEGPFKKGARSSYLFNYRYSTLKLLDQLGVNVGVGGTDFQDLSYHLYLPTKSAGTFSLFGFGGRNAQAVDAEEDSSKWTGEGDRYSWTYKGNTYMSGANHQIRIGSKALLKTGLGWSTASTRDFTERLNDQMRKDVHFEESNTTEKWTLNSTLHYKLDGRNILRTGVIVNHISFDYYQQSRSNVNAPLATTIDAKDNTQTWQAFAQWQTKVSPKLTFNAGVHYLRLLLNNSQAIEPRIGAQYIINDHSSFALGYGLHSQMQAMGVYFGRQAGTPEGVLPNKDLGFTRSNHFVASYSYLFNNHLRLKTELYYQRLSNIPVGNSDTSTFATVNIAGGFITDELENSGTGRNHGLEISLERYLHHNFYLMWSNSLYSAKYTALDGIERNTRYNGRYTSNLVAGKDFVSANRRRTIGVNIKMVWAGGFRETPINEAASATNGYAVYYDQRAFEMQLPAYFRTDVRFSISWNHAHRTSTLSLDVQNVSNRANVFGQFYDATRQEIKTAYQAGLIPVLNYKIEF